MKYGKYSSLRIVIAGYIVGGPLGGLVWHHLQYVLGLSRLGHDVLFVEDSDDYPSCYNPETHELSTDPTYGTRFIDAAFTRFDLDHKWAYYNAHSNQWLGRDEEEVKTFCATADLFLNLSGLNPLREIFQPIPVRVFIDTDPVFTQIRHLTDPKAFKLAKRHNHFFTFGENFGKGESEIPDDGLPWKATRQPVVTDIWAYTPGNEQGKWTTVMQWDSYKVRAYKGKAYGMKSASFGPYLNFPDHISDPLELAIGSESAPRAKLSQAGWLLADPLFITKIPESYKQYIQSSKGEWSIAKQGYVITGSGWFSERSTCYLASGRPVIVQDTGFSRFIESGEGLLPFTSLEEAIEAIKKVNRNYKKHCEAARSVAEEYFKFDKVLNNLLNLSFEQTTI
jgi:hypothetical protein